MRKITNDQRVHVDKPERNPMKKQQMVILAAVMLSLSLPVGAVTVNVQESGVLTIKGTGKNDWITLTGGGVGLVEVRSGKNASVVEGSFADVSDIVVKAKGGKNQVSFTDVNLPGEVKVKAGSGNDKVKFSGQFSAGGDLIVDLNGGDNTVSMDGEASIEIGGSAIFDGNKGEDKLTLTSISTGKHLMIGTSGGQDKIVLGKKNSYLVNIGNRLTIAGGRGNNTINVFGAEVASAIRLVSGRDVDNYSIQDISTGSFLDVKSGGGNDRIVSKNNLVTEDYRIHCGGGSDNVISSNDTASEVLQQRCGD